MLRTLLTLALIVVVLALPHHDLSATTVRPVRQTCPVCSNTFVFMSIASYTHFGCRERDFSDMPFALFGEARTCPHCLYSALGGHFAAGTPKLRGELEALAQSLDAERVQALKDNGDMLRLLIAQECLKKRRASLEEQIKLQLHVYFASKRQSDASLLKRERERLILMLEQASKDGIYSGLEDVHHTYLRGELLRLSGDSTQAMVLFAKAKSDFSKLAVAALGEDPKEAQWIVRWCDEQSRRITFPQKTVAELTELLTKDELDRNAALIALAEKDDPAAWKSIAGYVMQDSERLIDLEDRMDLTREKMQLDPEFWKWGVAEFKRGEKKDSERSTRFRNRFEYLFSDARNTWNPRPAHAVELARELRALGPDFSTTYTIKAGDTLGMLAQLFQLPVDRLHELNPQIRNRDVVRAGDTLKLLKLPKDWTEKQVLRHLPLALAENEPAVCAFFLHWVQTIGPRGLDEYSTDIRAILRALPGRPGLEAALKLNPSEAGVNSSRRLLVLALHMLAGNKEAHAKILELLNANTFAPLGFTAEHWGIASSTFVVCNNPGLKNELLQRFRRPPEGAQNLEWAFAETFEQLGTAADVGVLERLIVERPLATEADEEKNIHTRHRLESTLLNLKLRLLAEECQRLQGK